MSGIVRGLFVLGLFMTLACAAGCACTHHEFKLVPKKDMNDAEAAVAIDVVWTSSVERARELYNEGAKAWFVDGNRDSLIYEGRKITQRIEVEEARIGQSVDLNYALKEDDAAFVIFALYRNINDDPPPRNLAYYHPQSTENAKKCRFKVTLEKDGIYVEVE